MPQNEILKTAVNIIQKMQKMPITERISERVNKYNQEYHSPVQEKLQA